MKITYQIAIIILLSNILWAQDRDITGFLEFKWGTKTEEITKSMLQREGVTFLEKDGNKIIFKGGKLNNFYVDSWIFKFYKNKFCGIGVFFLRSEHQTKNFDILTEKLRQKYGDATLGYDGKTLQYMWTRGSSAQQPESQILLLLKKQVELIYVYYPLIDKADTLEEEMNQQDKL